MQNILCEEQSSNVLELQLIRQSTVGPSAARNKQDSAGWRLPDMLMQDSGARMTAI